MYYRRVFNLIFMKAFCKRSFTSPSKTDQPRHNTTITTDCLIKYLNHHIFLQAFIPLFGPIKICFIQEFGFSLNLGGSWGLLGVFWRAMAWGSDPICRFWEGAILGLAIGPIQYCHSSHRGSRQKLPVFIQ